MLIVESGPYCGRAFAGLARTSGAATAGSPLRVPTMVNSTGAVDPITTSIKAPSQARPAQRIA